MNYIAQVKVKNASFQKWLGFFSYKCNSNIA